MRPAWHAAPRWGACLARPTGPTRLINLACLALVVIGGLVALRSWGRTRREKSGDGHALLETGEGRTRFLAACGILSALGFAIAILFNTAEFLNVPVCWGIAS